MLDMLFEENSKLMKSFLNWAKSSNKTQFNCKSLPTPLKKSIKDKCSVIAVSLNSVNYVAYLTLIFIIQLIIQLSDTVRIPIFWLAELHLVIQGCNGSASLTLLSWDSRGWNSTHHRHYTMASADSKFHDFSDADIDSPIDDAIPKNTKKATAWEISVLKGKVENFKFFI